MVGLQPHSKGVCKMTDTELRLNCLLIVSENLRSVHKADSDYLVTSQAETLYKFLKGSEPEQKTTSDDIPF